jgi:hypothetical protein
MRLIGSIRSAVLHEEITMTRMTEGQAAWQDESFRSLTPNWRRVTLYLIAAGIALAVLTGALFVWKHFSADPSEAEITASLTNSVKHSMQHDFDNDTRFRRYGMNVKDVLLVKQNGNSYDGIATVTVPGDSADHQVAIQVTADKDGGAIWHTGPGAFLFLLSEPPLTQPPVLTAPASP